MMRPPIGVCAFMIRIAPRAHRNIPVRLILTISRQTSVGRSSIGTGGPPRPALLNSTSSRPKRRDTSAKSALTLASSFSAYTYLKKTVKLETVQSLAAETIALVPFATVGLAISAFSGHIAMGNHGIGLSARLVGLGVVTAVPLLLFGVATNRIPLSVMGLLQYCTPVVQFALGIFVFHEAVPTARWVGFGLIWCGLILLTIEALVNARSSALANPDL